MMTFDRMRLGEMMTPTVEAFAAGIAVGALTSYALYKTATLTRKPSLFGRWQMGKEDGGKDEELDGEIAFHFADPKLYVPIPRSPSVRGTTRWRLSVVHDGPGGEFCSTLCRVV